MIAHHLPEDPYAFARISAMKGMLLKKSDYDKLLKMQHNEIVKVLQDGAYREDIAALESTTAPTRLVEAAVSRNLERTYAKLRRITSGQLMAVISLYLDRNDVWNLKNVARAVASGVREGVEQRLMPVGTLDKQTLLGYLKTGSIQELSKQIQSMTGKESFTSVAELEDSLTRRYYEDALASTADLHGTDAAIRAFIVEEVAIINIATILKFKAAHAPAELLLKKIIGGQNKLIKALIAAPSVDAAFDVLAKSAYKLAATDGMSDWTSHKSLAGIESALFRSLLRTTLTLMRKNPLSPEHILGFLFAKSIEAKNLRLISKGKELGLNQEFIEKELVTL